MGAGGCAEGWGAKVSPHLGPPRPPLGEWLTAYVAAHSPRWAVDFFRWRRWPAQRPSTNLGKRRKQRISSEAMVENPSLLARPPAAAAGSGLGGRGQQGGRSPARLRPSPCSAGGKPRRHLGRPCPIVLLKGSRNGHGASCMAWFSSAFPFSGGTVRGVLHQLLRDQRSPSDLFPSRHTLALGRIRPAVPQEPSFQRTCIARMRSSPAPQGLWGFWPLLSRRPAPRRRRERHPRPARAPPFPRCFGYSLGVLILSLLNLY